MRRIFYPDGAQLKYAWVLLDRKRKQPTLIVLVFFESEAKAKAYAEDVLRLGRLGYRTYEMTRMEVDL